MLGEAQQQAIVKQFELKVKLADKRFDECLKIFFTETDINNDFHSIKSEYPNLHILKIDNATDEKQILEINTADVLVWESLGVIWLCSRVCSLTANEFSISLDIGEESLPFAVVRFEKYTLISG